MTTSAIMTSAYPRQTVCDRVARVRSAQECTNARQQLAGREGFRQVVICT